MKKSQSALFCTYCFASLKRSGVPPCVEDEWQEENASGSIPDGVLLAIGWYRMGPPRLEILRQ